ncbi:MAG: AMP-binding protein [Proteobacteria bacterium]|nr:AMP-binding protein [Pseudomonadota bacterium]
MASKEKGETHPTAEVPAYDDFMAAFRAEDVAAMLSGDLATGLNVCVECCDRHADGDRVALYWESADGDSSVHTFADLRDDAARFANFLKAQGIGPGDRVAVMLPRIPELMVAALGVWRAGAVYAPMFTAFGPKAIEYRLERSAAKLIVIDPANRPKLDDVANAPPILVVARAPDDAIAPGDLKFDDELAGQKPAFEPVLRGADDPFLLMFTSGTVGSPKGVAVPHKALLSFIAYMKYAVDLKPEDKFWNMADPGWAYGLYYAVVGAALVGVATHFYEGAFSVESTYKMLEKYGITVFCSAPTAYRFLMAGGDGMADACQAPIRVACSCGEPLNPEVIHWVNDHLGCPIHDQYGQTEVGVVVTNHHGLDHPSHPGSMGVSMPGFRAVIVDASGRELGPGNPGRLAIDTRASPLYWFLGYEGKDSPLEGPYYITGDMAEMDEDGCITFMGRDDDIILSAGYRIGPFDVESCLIEHPAVAESGVVGKTDAERGEIVVAFVVLRPDHKASPDLARELQDYTREQLSAHAYPREVVFVDELPKTPSGKIRRYVLREQTK